MANKTLGNEMSHNWVCDELPSSFNVMPLPGLTTFLWASQTVASTMKLFFRRIITGCLKSSVNSCLPSLSTMQISPSLSRKESRHYRVLHFLISDFFTFVNWRSVLESARWNFCKAPISLGNATLCTSLRTVFSALSSCSIRGVTSIWVVSASPCTRASDALLRLEREYPGKRSLQLVPFGKSGNPRQKVFVLINAFAVHKDLFNFRVFYGDIV